MRSLLTRSRHHPAYPLHAHRHRQTSTMLTWRISPTASLDTHRGLSYGRDADNTPCFCALQGAWRAAIAGIEGFPGLGPSSGRTGHVRSRPRQGGRTPFPLYRTLLCRGGVGVAAASERQKRGVGSFAVSARVFSRNCEQITNSTELPRGSRPTGTESIPPPAETHTAHDARGRRAASIVSTQPPCSPLPPFVLLSAD
jgi:hypothetical protein